MLLITANAIVRRLGDKINQLYPDITNREIGDDGSYHVYYGYGSGHIHRAPGNSVHVRIFVPQQVGARYLAHSRYFQASVGAHNHRQFDKTIHHEGEEEELTSHTLELVALYHVRNAEK